MEEEPHIKEEIVWIDIDELGVDVCNIRQGKWNYDMDFVEDIKNNSVMHPLTVRPIVSTLTEKKYAIVAGSRRYNAAIEAGMHKVPCIIREMDDKNALARSMAENKHRSDISAYDYVIQVLKLNNLIIQEGKCSTKEEIIQEIASITGHKRTAIQRYISVAGLPSEVLDLLKPRGAKGVKVLSQHVAANISTKLKECTAERKYEVAEQTIGMNEDTANEFIDIVKAHPDTPVRDVRLTMKGEPLTGRYTIDLDDDAQNALKEACGERQENYKQLINRALKSFVKNKEVAQEERDVPATASAAPAPEALFTPPAAELPTQTDPINISDDIRKHLESSGLSANNTERTEKVLSAPYWLAKPDDVKKKYIDSQVEFQRNNEEWKRKSAEEKKKTKDELEAVRKKMIVEERKDPARNPKTADPDTLFWCNGCSQSFRIKHSDDRNSCPHCHSTDIQYDEFSMNCGDGTCWRPKPPKPLKDTLIVCPCGCGYGCDDEGKWYSPAQYDGVTV